MTGYGHHLYTKSLSEFGEPRFLESSGGHILERRIPNTPYCDAMGPYPLFSCSNWGGLPDDIDKLSKDLVSITLVTDPCEGPDGNGLYRLFAEDVRPFKEHYIVDLEKPFVQNTKKQHRRRARRALEKLRVEIVAEPKDNLDEWVFLYDLLIARHAIKGIRCFSRYAFGLQLRIPGAVYMRATLGTRLVGAQICLISGAVIHAHLMALTTEGYEQGASYAMDAFALDHFSKTAKWYHLGGGIGSPAASKAKDGLAAYKEGWSNETRTSYLLTRILHKRRYRELAEARGAPNAAYFPAYRIGEF